MDSKTPVTLLQEYLMQNGCTPDYQLIHNGVGTHNPLFIYEVSGLGEIATGEGKSKREAKHAAARQLLLKINSQRSDGEELKEIVQSPYADNLKENAIGALQDFCATYKINPPEFEQTRDEGLPHAKLFGMRCKVSNLSTVAEARTKKQAKQNASRLMLQKLKDCLTEDQLAQFTVERNFQDDEEKKLDMLCMEKVSEHLENQPKSPQIQPLGIPLDEFDEVLKNGTFPYSEALKNLKGKDETYFQTVEDPLSIFVELANEMELKWIKHEISTKSKTKMFAIQVGSLNNCTFFGRGQDDDSAIQEAALSGLKWFSAMAI